MEPDNSTKPICVEDLLDKTITNIYVLIQYERGGLDTAECFVELDNQIIIDIPFGFSEEIWVKPCIQKQYPCSQIYQTIGFITLTRIKKTLAK